MNKQTISNKSVMCAFEAYYSSVVFEKDLQKLKIFILENPEYMSLSALPFYVCMEKLMGELGLSVEDDRAYDNVGAWLTRICGELADNHVKIKPDELLDLCVNKIRKAIEDKEFYIYG